jgi:hypothetical protein
MAMTALTTDERAAMDEITAISASALSALPASLQPPPAAVLGTGICPNTEKIGAILSICRMAIQMLAAMLVDVRVIRKDVRAIREHLGA